MSVDLFSNYKDSPIAPSGNCFPIVPNDADTLALITKAIYVGQGGDVALIGMQSSEAVIFRNVPSGAILDVRAVAVLAAGTTADHIVGLA